MGPFCKALHTLAQRRQNTLTGRTGSSDDGISLDSFARSFTPEFTLTVDRGWPSGLVRALRERQLSTPVRDGILVGGVPRQTRSFEVA